MLSDPLLCLRSINRLGVILALMCGVRTSHYDEIESLSERRESEEIMMVEVCVGNFAEMCIVPVNCYCTGCLKS